MSCVTEQCLVIVIEEAEIMAGSWPVACWQCFLAKWPVTAHIGGGASDTRLASLPPHLSLRAFQSHACDSRSGGSPRGAASILPTRRTGRRRENRNNLPDAE